MVGLLRHRGAKRSPFEGIGVMDDCDIASEREQIARDAAIAFRRRSASIDVAPLVCEGCDAFPQQRACGDFKDCLHDYERRAKAAERNGRAP